MSNLSQLAKHFSDENAARELLEQWRWKGHPACPHCGGADPTKLTPKAGSSTRKGVWKCKACRKQFTVTVGTIFEASHIPISKWLLAIHLLNASKKGMSAHQIHRMLGVSYKTAWFMLHRLRAAMAQEPMVSKLKGIVEVDETYVGKKGTYQTRWDNKVAVVGLVQRGGDLRTRTMDRVTAENIGPIMAEYISAESAIMTDESRLYSQTHKSYASHETVKHSAKEYARGNVHTNTIEGFFGIFKRGLAGVYHHIGRKNVGRYVDEFTYRYNTRKMSDAARAELMVTKAEGKRLLYRQPIAKVN